MGEQSYILERMTQSVAYGLTNTRLLLATNSVIIQGPLLPTWINFDPSLDK